VKTVQDLVDEANRLESVAQANVRGETLESLTEPETVAVEAPDVEQDDSFDDDDASSYDETSVPDVSSVESEDSDVPSLGEGDTEVASVEEPEEDAAEEVRDIEQQDFENLEPQAEYDAEDSFDPEDEDQDESDSSQSTEVIETRQTVEHVHRVEADSSPVFGGSVDESPDNPGIPAEANNPSEIQIDAHMKVAEDFSAHLAREFGDQFDDIRSTMVQSTREYVENQALITSYLSDRG